MSKLSTRSKKRFKGRSVYICTISVSAELIVTLSLSSSRDALFIPSQRLLGRQYDADINQQRRTTPRLLDLTAFSVVKLKLTHYALKLTSWEWSATKQLADDIEDGKEEEFQLDPDVGCSFGCELPARFNLPCRHWMYSSVVE
jgi:hypothetical protein